MPETNVVRTGDGIVLTPDPSVLTRESIDRDITAMRELVRVQLSGEINAIRARIDAMDRAIVVFNDNLTRVPTDVDKQVGNLKDLMLETFSTVNQRFETVERLFEGVQTQFIERDVRVKESATATATAVAAALQAAKEAVGEQNKSFTVSIDKSEKATGEQITQQRALLDTTSKGLSDKIDDLKERLARTEAQVTARGDDAAANRASIISIQGEISGLRESRSAQHGIREQSLDSRTVLFAIIGFLFTLMGLGVAIAVAVTR